jgi:hypothetical protein
MNTGKARNILVLIYHSFNDPLFQNQIYKHLLRIVKDRRYNIYLITFENDSYLMSPREQNNCKEQLSNKKIFWYPLKYHGGNLLVLKKSFDLLQAIIVAVKIRFTKNTPLIFAYTNLSASISMVCAKLLGMKLLVYCYEPHSGYLIELGIWKEKSLKYILSNWLEIQVGKYGDYILASTIYVVEMLKKHSPHGNIYKQPIVVDSNEFRFKPKGRQKIREQYKIDNRKVVLYLGKFGYLYYEKEIAGLCKILDNNIDNLFFLIVTSNNHDYINGMFIENGLKDESYVITGNLNYDEVKDYISASDIGLSAVPPTCSQKYRSPNKVGEYLMCGLPYITCKGISEDDIYAEKYNVGAVVKSFNERDILLSLDKINELISEEKQVLRLRCRKAGLEYRGTSRYYKRLDAIFEDVFEP